MSKSVTLRGEWNSFPHGRIRQGQEESSRKTCRAAVTVRSRSDSWWAAEMKRASYWAGGR